MRLWNQCTENIAVIVGLKRGEEEQGFCWVHALDEGGKVSESVLQIFYEARVGGGGSREVVGIKRGWEWGRGERIFSNEEGLLTFSQENNCVCTTVFSRNRNCSDGVGGA